MGVQDIVPARRASVAKKVFMLVYRLMDTVGSDL